MIDILYDLNIQRYLEMTITTKKGDGGYTSDFHGNKRDKGSDIIGVQGKIDMLNCYIGGVLINKDDAILHDLQNEFFNIGSVISGYIDTYNSSNYVDRMDAEIKRLTTELPKLTNFVFPRGSRECIDIHLCRVHCREAEHELCKLEKTEANMECIKLLNRLSDYLFMLAYEQSVKEDNVIKFNRTK